MERRSKSTLVEDREVRGLELLVENLSYPFWFSSRSFFFGEEQQREF
jgi:hypothetical protein